MDIVRLLQGFILLSGGFGLSIPCLALSGYNESDAMQITTHFNDLTGIACDNTAQYCVAVGAIAYQHTLDHRVYTTGDGGVTWSQGVSLIHPKFENQITNPINNSQMLMSIRCDKTGHDCLVAGNTIIDGRSALLTYTSHDAGMSWSDPNLISLGNELSERTWVDNYPYLRLKCNTRGSWCLLASNTITNKQHTPVLFTTQNTGETWSPVSYFNLPTNAPNGIDIQDLSCDESGLICTALASTPDSASDINDPDSLSPNVSLIYSTHDGGITWSDAKPFMVARGSDTDTTLSTNDILSILSCDPSGLSCIALGNHYVMQHTENSVEILDSQVHSYLTKNGGFSWQDTTEIPPTDKTSQQAFTALDCDASNRFCAAVGIIVGEEENKIQPIIYTTTDSGQTWQKKPFLPPANSSSMMLDVFCSEDAAFCHTVGFLLD